MDQEYVNLNEVTDAESRIELYQIVAQLLKEDNWEYVNSFSAKVYPRNSMYTKYVKRTLDIVISFSALLITAPINLLIAGITYLDVGRPIFFRQKRPGKDGKLFTIVKFRNMTNEMDEHGDLLPASKRVTKWGKFVRKTSLDELLNFWSILKGDMSLIGPRPLDCVYLDRYSIRHKMRNSVLPGLECPLLNTLDHKISWYEQFENDVFYVENICFSLDMKMLFHLVKMVFNRRSYSMRGEAMRGGFMGYDRDGNTVNAQKVPKEYVERALLIQHNHLS